jgi:cystathionine beta-lyase/cystathionine gamma-synthase
LEPIARHAKTEGLALLVDATFASPINCRPLEHGADVVIHSVTKYLNGHSDVTAGAVAGTQSVIEEVRHLMQVWGQAIDPHAAWLIERGLKTLAVRVERHNANGLAFAAWASERGEIAAVHYPGLASHPDHAIAKRQLDGFGGVVGLQIKGGARRVERMLRRLRVAYHAPSLGGVETLVSEPRLTSHASLTPAERSEQGIPDGFVRVSLGIEDIADIIADFEHALAD